MPRNELLDNWRKDPKKAEKIFLIYKFVVIAVNILLFFGFAFFIYLLVKGNNIHP
jgi:hypothetical protein